ncbi:hypothetical protein, partial [Mesorhizobium sp. M7A.T.Ca.US.000.02.1.1]|uniref:hypothetical protein n=1 Tax=Mesorhizobium sp. M7A.T.Ca.US.000.02.1.1 TaxID=2496792 RepID=UPI0019D4A81D
MSRPSPISNVEKKDPARTLPISPLFGPETSRTGVRRHREQFPMLSADCVEVDGLDFLVSEVDVEDT